MTNTLKSDQMGHSALDPAWSDDLTARFGDERANRVARNAATSSNLMKAARNVSTLRAYHDTFGVSRPRTGEVTNQRHSGRCWMFSALNVARAATMELLDVDSFEFSQVYGMFYDKLEKFNSGLGRVVATAERPTSDREVAYVLDEAMGDGGYYPFAMNLIAKWGVVPKDAMPETACSKDSSQMNQQLKRLFHRSAGELRARAAAGATTAELDDARRQMVAACHRVLCVCLGEPPLTFDLEVPVGKKCRLDRNRLVRQEGAPIDAVSNAGAEKDDERWLLVDRGLTPRTFCERYVPFDPADYVDLVCMPGDERPWGSVWHPTLTDSVEGGRPVRWLNVGQDVLEAAAVASLRAGQPCSMSCDVAQDFPRHIEDFPGVLACDTMDYEGLLGVELGMGRTDMLDLRETSLTHAMTFQGVELGADGSPVAWRIENSWGKEACKDGYLVASADWYRTYGGEVVVKREFVPADVLALWDEKPATDVAPWDSIGTCLPRQD